MRWPQVRWCGSSVDCSGWLQGWVQSVAISQYSYSCFFAQFLSSVLQFCIYFVSQFEFELVEWTGGIFCYLTHRPLPTRGYHWSSLHHYLTNTALHSKCIAVYIIALHFSALHLTTGHQCTQSDSQCTLLLHCCSFEIALFYQGGMHSLHCTVLWDCIVLKGMHSSVDVDDHHQCPSLLICFLASIPLCFSLHSTLVHSTLVYSILVQTTLVHITRIVLWCIVFWCIPLSCTDHA